jgi:hypothetical protein
MKEIGTKSYLNDSKPNLLSSRSCELRLMSSLIALHDIVEILPRTSVTLISSSTSPFKANSSSHF